MTESSPAIALLFDDTKLGGQLRQALNERGARIVHEGAVSSLDRELLQQLCADVLVVNLDDAAEDALDSLYELIDNDNLRVVFNDAQASRALTGWDRARWARHLAVKVMAMGDVDPPRPVHARDVEHAAFADMDAEAAALPPAPGDLAVPNTTSESLPPDAQTLDAETVSGAERERELIAASENLEAELEALLASGEIQDPEDVSPGPALRQSDKRESQRLHDGDFEDVVASATGPQPAADAADGLVAGAPAAKPTLEQDHLTLAPLAPESVDASSESNDAVPTPPPSGEHHGWSLLGDDEEPAAGTSVKAPSGGKPDAAEFGIEKISASEFLAPSADSTSSDNDSVEMSLQLISMEEAVAPQQFETANEMSLDDSGTALRRVVMLGGAASATESVCAFLAALPATSRSTFVYIQHQGEQSTAELVARMVTDSALPVRQAEQGQIARPGSVWVIPAGQKLSLLRDGKIALQAGSDEAAQTPSIDASFTMAAHAFGRDALAIVFAGRGTDGVAGAQAIHDRGGQVWVETSSGEHFADMVSGIVAERLVSFSGTPPELAAHLVEVFS